MQLDPGIQPVPIWDPGLLKVRASADMLSCQALSQGKKCGFEMKKDFFECVSLSHRDFGVVLPGKCDIQGLVFGDRGIMGKSE